MSSHSSDARCIKDYANSIIPETRTCLTAPEHIRYEYILQIMSPSQEYISALKTKIYENLSSNIDINSILIF